MHEHLGTGGSRTQLRKTRGGDQGDALTALIFPLVYKQVSVDTLSSISADDPNAGVYTYQDDLELCCDASGIARAGPAYQIACTHAGLRANLRKTRATQGREANPMFLPSGMEIYPVL